MFKKVVGFEVVPHRMGGNHAARDPLMDEKVGSAKRRKASDGSDVVHYRETDEERKARIRADKAADKAKTEEAAPKVKEEPKIAAMEKPRKAVAANLQVKLGSFKEKLKGSSLPSEAADAERKHKEELEAEKAHALAKSSLGQAASASATPGAAASSAAAASPAVPGATAAATAAEGDPGDPDKRIAFAEIWKEGDEESAADWLTGGGLKFHTTADKAFSMDSKRFKESAGSRDSLENQEAAAELAKKRSEMRMADFRRGQKG